MQPKSSESRRIKILPPISNLILGNARGGRYGDTPKPRSAFRKLGLLYSKHISSLKIDSTDRKFRGDIQKLLQAKPLKKLEITVKDPLNSELQVASNLFKKLGSKTLRKLRFSFQAEAFFGNENPEENLKLLTRHLRCLTNLTDLSFQIEDFPQIKGSFLQLLGRSFQYLPDIERLKLSIGGCNRLEKKRLEDLKDSLSKLNASKVQSLSFDLSRIFKSLSELLPKMMGLIERFTNLRELELWTGENYNLGFQDYISTKAMRESMSFLPKLKSLERVSFLAADTLNIEKQGILMECVRANPNIKKLDLKLDSMDRFGFESLGASLRKLNPLEELSLDLRIPSWDLEKTRTKGDISKIFDSSFTCLAEGLQGHSATLKRLNLRLNIFGLQVQWREKNMAYHPEFQGYTALARVLTDCSKLEDLSVKYQDPLKSVHVAETCRAIKNMKGMKRLMLEMELQEEAENDAIILGLKEALDGISGVEKLSLLFSKVGLLTNAHLDGLLGEISKMDSLREFAWKFGTMPQISKLNENPIVEILKGLKALRIAELDFCPAEGKDPNPFVSQESRMKRREIWFGKKLIVTYEPNNASNSDNGL